MRQNTRTIMVVAYQNNTGSYIFEVNSTSHHQYVKVPNNTKTISNEFIEDSTDNRFLNYLNFQFDIPFAWVAENTTEVIFASNEDSKSTIGGILQPHTKLMRVISTNFNVTDFQCAPKPLSGTVRLDIKIYGFFIATEVWLTIVLIVALYLYITRSQPAYSRSIAPFITLISYILGSYAIWFSDQYMTYEWYVAYGCLLENLFTSTLYSIAYLIGFLNYVRYVLINNLNWSKQQYYSQEDGNVKLRWHVRILNFLTTGFGLGLMVSIVVGLLWTYHIIHLAVIRFSCKRMRETEASIYFIHAIVVLCLTFAFQLLDILLNWRMLIKCSLREFFWKSDPYYSLCHSHGLATVLPFILEGFYRVVQANGSQYDEV